MSETQQSAVSTETPPPNRPRRSLLRTIFVVFTSIVLLLVVVVALAAYLIVDHALSPGVPGETARFHVPDGATGGDVADRLAEAGFVEHPVFFQIALRASTSNEPIKAGAFELPRGLSAAELLEILQQGRNQVIDPGETTRIAFPEGLTIRQMADLRDDPEAFMAATQDPALPERLGIEAPTIEGFLMPNTYFFAGDPDPAEVVERMVAQFEREYAALIEKYPGAADRDKLEIVTVASIVEEEARLDDERPLIAAVIYNRLERNRALEMDSTLQYALGKYGQRMLHEDKEIDSPYNTYKYPGLPPGPISNPGAASIEAAISPAEVDYLYFVSNADGLTHTFSSTLREHNAAVAKFRRDIAVQRREQRRNAAEQGDQ